MLNRTETFRLSASILAELYPFNLLLACGDTCKVDLNHCIWSSYTNQHVTVELDRAGHRERLSDVYLRHSLNLIVLDRKGLDHGLVDPDGKDLTQQLVNTVAEER